jgi:transposase-like protein
MEVETPRDRKGTFKPKIVAKGQARFTGCEFRCPAGSCFA